jgi:DNA-binding NarL/FixJ family response regulator
MNPLHPIIIADGQFLVTESLQKFLYDEFAIKVKWLVKNKHDLIKAISDEPGSLLIIDFNLIDFNDLSEFCRFTDTHHCWSVLVMTNSISRNELSELIACGIKNILLKTAEPDELASAIRSALSGRKYYCQEVLDMFTEIHKDKGIIRENVTLTNAEIEIVRAIAEGSTTKQIAANKHVSFHTVMTHRKNIFRKLNVGNASELVMFAIRTGIIDTIEYHI